MITASDITRGKPDPQPYLAGAAALGFDPRTCLVFEDAPSGIRAALAAGATVIALPTTYPHTPNRALPAGASHTHQTWPGPPCPAGPRLAAPSRPHHAMPALPRPTGLGLAGPDHDAPRLPRLT
jgi:hypothetical protein